MPIPVGWAPIGCRYTAGFRHLIRPLTTLIPMIDLERTQEVLSVADVAELLGMHVQMVSCDAGSAMIARTGQRAYGSTTRSA
jgi:hypothetical protein